MPFSKDINAAVIWAHVEEMPTAPSSVQPTLPPSIDHALAKALAKDPDNRLFGRMSRRRLEAEAIRDSLLAVAGRLDLRTGGPAFADMAVPRRTLYLMSVRTGANACDAPAGLYIHRVTSERDRQSATDGDSYCWNCHEVRYHRLRDPDRRDLSEPHDHGQGRFGQHRHLLQR